MTPKRRDSLPSPVIPQNRDAEASPRVRPRSLALAPGAACDGHAYLLADLLLLGEPNPVSPSPRTLPERRPRGPSSPIRSLRLRHTTPWLGPPSSQRKIRPSRPLRQLVKVPPRFRSPQSLPKPYSLVKGDMRTVLRLRSRRCRHLVAQ